VHGVERHHPVELLAGHLEHGNLSLRRELNDLLNTVIHLDVLRDVQSRGRNLGAQCLDGRVATGHHLSVILSARRRTALPLLRARLAVLRVGGLLAPAVLRPVTVLRPRRWTLTLEGLAAEAAGALRGALLL